MKKLQLILTVLLISLILGGCYTTPRKENAAAGLAVGAGVGAATGNPALAAAGALVGGAIGYAMNTNGKPPVLASNPQTSKKYCRKYQS